EDAGKNIHTMGDFSAVDLNRAGTPLLEIVTEPDMNSAGEVRSLAIELQKIVRYLGISRADMQKGHMRFEPNINLIITKDGEEYRTPIVEVKNLNSFRALERSVAYETDRQLDEFIETGITIQSGNKSTRGWDDERQCTFPQRIKEEAHDYRYFPDPDLVPVEMTGQWLSEIKSRLCELPIQKQSRFVSEFNLTDYDAGVLTAERATAEYFEDAVKAGGGPKRLCNLLTQTGAKIANEKGCSIVELGINAVRLAKLAKMTDAGDVSASAAAEIFGGIIGTDWAPDEWATEHNLIQKSDAGEIELLVDKVIAANPKAVEEVTSGGKKSKKSLNFLLGQVMQKSGGRANPKIVAEILNRKIQQ
ncbi:MAG: Asp-tRNA(Asn)/Glu-tRNA(Gln) amidotransferase subunit GatB, partial [Planctomycetes bacterium]|nr:Asp-tRNA(Asn)/Glu-tRNA(Gln) amidotransferase subunit GatB [Planctomycetota bacterium]